MAPNPTKERTGCYSSSFWASARWEKPHSRAPCVWGRAGVSLEGCQNHEPSMYLAYEAPYGIRYAKRDHVSYNSPYNLFWVLAWAHLWVSEVALPGPLPTCQNTRLTRIVGLPRFQLRILRGHEMMNVSWPAKSDCVVALHLRFTLSIECCASEFRIELGNMGCSTLTLHPKPSNFFGTIGSP